MKHFIILHLTYFGILCLQKKKKKIDIFLLCRISRGEKMCKSFSVTISKHFFLLEWFLHLLISCASVCMYTYTKNWNNELHFFKDIRDLMMKYSNRLIPKFVIILNVLGMFSIFSLIGVTVKHYYDNGFWYCQILTHFSRTFHYGMK